VPGDQEGLETALPVARDVDSQRAVFRQHRLAADAVAVIASTFGFVGARRVTQVMAELGAQRARSAPS
jgi:hypothetical protein